FLWNVLGDEPGRQAAGEQDGKKVHDSDKEITWVHWFAHGFRRKRSIARAFQSSLTLVFTAATFLSSSLMLLLKAETCPSSFVSRLAKGLRVVVSGFSCQLRTRSRQFSLSHTARIASATIPSVTQGTASTHAGFERSSTSFRRRDTSSLSPNSLFSWVISRSISSSLCTVDFSALAVVVRKNLLRSS